MEKYYSKLDPEELLHMVVRKEDFQPGRIDLIDAHEFLQCSLLNFPMGHTFRPHKHVIKECQKTTIAQEAWVCLSGKVKCTYYDFDDSILATVIINEGDASFTLHCGHNYEILTDSTRVMEFKTGPYHGQQLDKVFINE